MPCKLNTEAEKSDLLNGKIRLVLRRNCFSVEEVAERFDVEVDYVKALKESLKHLTLEGYNADYAWLSHSPPDDSLEEKAIMDEIDELLEKLAGLQAMLDTLVDAH